MMRNHSVVNKPARPSLLMQSARLRLAGAGGLIVLLWLAVAWALGEPG